jgi:hypothetical protein
MHDRAEQRRLAVAVEADDRQPLAGSNREIDLVQHPQRTVTGGQARDAEQLVAHAAPSK